MKKRVNVLLLTFLLVVSLLQCYAVTEKQRNKDILREAKSDDSSLALTTQQYSNILGGSGADEVAAFKFVEPDLVYIAGTTSSTDFPIINGYQDTHAGNVDCFIMKFNIATDTVMYSTYIGGSDEDILTDIVVDDDGNLYATGFTESSDFPVVSAYKENYVNQEDIFLLKLNPTGEALLFSTYFGGDGSDKSYSIDIDTDGNVYIFGNGYASDIPLVNPLDDERYFMEEGYFLKFNSTGNGLEFSSYFGGFDRDYAKSIFLDDDNNVYLIGSTSSTDFPYLNGYDTSHNSAQDCFVVKVNSALDEVIYSTYIGGQAADEPFEAIVDGSGRIYLTGYTISSDFPTVNAYDDEFGGGMDCFVCVLSTDGSSLEYSTYLGGSAVDIGLVLLYSNEVVYITGYTKSSDFPTTNGAESSLSGEIDCFVSKLILSNNTLGYSTYVGGSGDDYGQGIALDADQNILVVGHSDSEDFPVDAIHSGMSDCFLYEIPKPVAPPGIDIPLLLYVGVGVAGVVIITVVVYSRRR
ncbi:MAG: SBBP repeat-containing protein [Candidatus Thorarchaeota archaeon]